MEFTGFTEDHVGEDVTDIIHGKGKIVRVDSDGDWPVVVDFENGEEGNYTLKGNQFSSDEKRSLYFGHNVKINVTGEEIPEKKLICPVCNREHLIGVGKKNGFDYNFFSGKGDDCPFYNSIFLGRDLAIDAMKNLIKAMEKKS